MRTARGAEYGPEWQQYILNHDRGKKRWVQVVSRLSRAFALCAASDEATNIRDFVSFFQALQAAPNEQSGFGSRWLQCNRLSSH